MTTGPPGPGPWTCTGRRAMGAPLIALIGCPGEHYALQGCICSPGSLGPTGYLGSRNNRPHQRLSGRSLPGPDRLMQELACSAVRASRCHGRGDPCRDVAIAITAAPAQNVRCMFAAPAVNHLGRHLELLAMLAPGLDQRTEVIHDLGGGVISDMRGAGERVMVYRATRGDRPGQPGRGRAPAPFEIGVNPHDVQ